MQLDEVLVMRWRAVWLSFLVAAWVPGGPAEALSLRILESEVQVDTFARAETNIDDPAPDRRRNIRIQIANTTFVDLDAASALGQAQSTVLPPIADPGDRPVKTTALVDVNLSSRGVLDAAASASASGFVELLVRSGPPGDALTTLLVDLDFLQTGDLSNPFSTSYVIENLSTGATLFDSATGGLPDRLELPLVEGQRLRVSYAASLSGAVSGDQMTDSRIELLSSITVVPEPSTWMLLALGLGAGAAGRRAARRRA